MTMAETSTPNPNSLESPPPPPPPPVVVLPPSPSPPVIILPTPPPPPKNPSRPGLSFPRPAIRFTQEFDSEVPAIFNKISCKLFDSLAKLKLSFNAAKDGQVSDPQIGLFTKYLSIQYDVNEQNALVKSSFQLGNKLQFRASQDIKSAQNGEPSYFRVGCSTKSLSMSCACDDRKSIVSCVNLGSCILFKYDHRKAQEGELSMVASLPDPSYKLELSSAVPFNALPRATFRFPQGEVSLEEKQDEEVNRALSVSGILKGQFLNGLCTAQYKDEDLNLRYCFKDEEMTFIPTISLPSNAIAFAFKRRFGPSDKMSYYYNIDSSYWNAVYKHTDDKHRKLKVGYDSMVRLGWASIWFGDENGKTKEDPLKMKVQLMLQVPQDDVKSPALMFKVKKRWDF